ncbi:hypothetical protein VB779_15920 [Haloarculaceae archaeon H-GB11]|nr:hypothetical protein [Haloarculaceae archaeon H-GB11]
MTRIQQVHWEHDMDYLGHPYYVSGNAIYHTLGRQLEHDVRQHINASHGMFVPGQFGTFPEEHSQIGIRPYMGSSLPNVESYDDLFLFRHPDHPWLLDSRPRDALNAHDIRIQSGMPALAHQTTMGRPEDHRKQQQTTRWYVTAYLHADDPETLPLGEVSLKDMQVIDLEDLDYSRLERGKAYILELARRSCSGQSIRRQTTSTFRGCGASTTKTSYATAWRRSSKEATSTSWRPSIMAWSLGTMVTARSRLRRMGSPASGTIRRTASANSESSRFRSRRKIRNEIQTTGTIKIVIVRGNCVPVEPHSYPGIHGIGFTEPS